MDYTFWKVMVVICAALIAFSAVDHSKYFIAFLCVAIIIFNIVAMDNQNNLSKHRNKH